MFVKTFQSVECSGMFYLVRRVCPQALQTCCNIPHLYRKNIPELNSRISLRGGGERDGLMVGKGSSLAPRLNKKYCRQLLYGVFPSPRLY